MVKGTASVVARVARAASAQPEVCDRELLRRFAVDGDQAAFTALVRRHAGMVLGICQRTLSNTQDAEDACQATFVVLARKAGTGPWQKSVSNWLYATARKVSRNARVAADRRVKREGRAAVPEAVSDLDQMTGREAFAILDEELDRLPPRHREPLVLCYLQGLTRDEAASRLGISPVTLKSQLDRGRKRLGQALTKRGVALGVGLLACAATSRVGAFPARLIEAVLATVAGEIPPTVDALAKGVAVNGIHNKLLIAVVVIAATVTIGFGLGEPTTTTAGQQSDKSTSAKKEAPVAKSKPDKTIEVSGRVVDPDGKPVAGAKFAVIDDEAGAPVPEVTSGKEGRFAFHMDYPKAVRNPRQVVAFAPGFGVDWLSEPRTDAVFHLVPDQPITGRVIDLQGKPVAGAKVEVYNVHSGPAGAFDQLLKNWNKSTDEQEQGIGKLDRAIWNRGGLGQAFHTTTIADGKFTLSGLGADRVVTLWVSGAGIADTFVDVATRKGIDRSVDPKAPKRMRGEGPRNPPRLIAPDFSLAVAPDKPISGVVLDESTRKPVAGVRVSGASYHGTIELGPLHFRSWPTPATVTDKDGRFTLRGLSKSKAYILVADPGEGTEHLHRFGFVEDTVGSDALSTSIELPHGVVLSGRVTDAVTGAGVPSRVFYKPLEKNDQIPGGYTAPDLPAPWHLGRDTKTDMDGRFKITVAPGVGVVNFQTYGGSYECAKATQQEIDDGIVDKQFGHFRTVGQSGYFNPEYMHAYKIINPAATDRTGTMDVKVQPATKK